MYSTLKHDELPRISNTLEEGTSTQVLKQSINHASPVRTQPHYFRYYIKTHEDNHSALKAYNLKKASTLCLQKFQNNHTIIIKERGKALGMEYVNKVF